MIKYDERKDEDDTDEDPLVSENEQHRREGILRELSQLQQFLIFLRFLRLLWGLRFHLFRGLLSPL